MAVSTAVNAKQHQESKSLTMMELIDKSQEKDLRLVLIGKSGHGKSSFGNTLCGRSAFSTSSSSSSHTKRSYFADRIFDDTSIIVYDTPGLFDTDADFSVIKNKICEAVTKMASPGPHAFLIVLSVGRFTEEEQKTVQLINDMFGKDAGKYCILVFTREDDILYDKTTIERYIENSKEPLKTLVAQCQNRYLAVNNRAGDDERDNKVRKLISIVQQMLVENQTPFYTNDMFKQAEENLRQQEEAALAEVNLQIEAKKQTLRDELRREFEEKSQKELIEAFKDLRLQQRENVAKDKSIDAKPFCDAAGILFRVIGDVIIANITHDKHSSTDEFSSDSIQTPIITFPDANPALAWSPSKDSNESNSLSSTVKTEEMNRSEEN